MLSGNQKQFVKLCIILFFPIAQQTLAGNFQAGVEFGLGPSAFIDFKSGNNGVSLGTLAGIKTLYPLKRNRHIEVGLFYSLYRHSLTVKYTNTNSYIRTRSFIGLNYIEIPVLLATPKQINRENKVDFSLNYLLGMSFAYLFLENFSPGNFPDEFENSGIFRKVSPHLFGGVEFWEIKQKNRNSIKFRSILSLSPLPIIKPAMQEHIKTNPDSWRIGKASRNIRLLFSVVYVVK